jgi:hypothetical protein
MTEIAAMSTKRRQKLDESLNGIKVSIERWDGKNPHALVRSIQKMNLDAIEVLKQPDPLLQKVGFIVLALQQSTEVKVRHVNGKRLVRITVLDKALHEWALEELHLLPAKLS